MVMPGSRLHVGAHYYMKAANCMGQICWSFVRLIRFVCLMSLGNNNSWSAERWIERYVHGKSEIIVSIKSKHWIISSPCARLCIRCLGYFGNRSRWLQSEIFQLEHIAWTGGDGQRVPSKENIILHQFEKSFPIVSPPNCYEMESATERR